MLRRMSRTATRVVGGVAVLAVVGGGVYWFGLRDDAAAAVESPEVTTQTTAASLTTLEKSVTASGTLTPTVKEDVSFEASGTVTSVAWSRPARRSPRVRRSPQSTRSRSTRTSSTRRPRWRPPRRSSPRARTPTTGPTPPRRRSRRTPHRWTSHRPRLTTRPRPGGRDPRRAGSRPAHRGEPDGRPGGDWLAQLSALQLIRYGYRVRVRPCPAPARARARPRRPARRSSSSAPTAGRIDITVDDSDVALVPVGDQAEITIEDVTDLVFGSCTEIGLISISTNGVADTR